MKVDGGGGAKWWSSGQLSPLKDVSRGNLLLRDTLCFFLPAVEESFQEIK